MHTLCFLLILASPAVDVDATMTVDYVLLDVIASLEDGTPVTDLNVDDFTVWDGRKKTKLESFELLDLANPEVHEEGPPPIEQSLILLLDLGSAEKGVVARSMEQLRTFFTRLDPKQPLKILLYSLEFGPVSRGVTSDPQVALDDLEAYVAHRAKMGNKPAIARASLAVFDRELAKCYPKSPHTSDCLRKAYQDFVTGQEVLTRRSLHKMKGLMGLLNLISYLNTIMI